MFHTKVVEVIKTKILGSIFFFFQKSCRLSDNVEKYCRAGQAPQMTIWRMRIVCWITKAKGTHSEYETLIAFPLQQQLQERA
jgi:hypothetical protein